MFDPNADGYKVVRGKGRDSLHLDYHGAEQSMLKFGGVIEALYARHKLVQETAPLAEPDNATVRKETP